MSCRYENKLLEEYDAQVFDVLSEDEKNYVSEYAHYTVDATITIGPGGGGGGDCFDFLPGIIMVSCCLFDCIFFGFVIDEWLLSAEHSSIKYQIGSFLMKYFPSPTNCCMYTCEGNPNCCEPTWNDEFGQPILYSICNCDWDYCCHERLHCTWNL